MKLSGDVLLELNMCIMAFMLGVKCHIAYDVLRIFRRIVKQHILLISIEDLIYFAIVGLLTFKTVFEGNNGTVRGFALSFVVIGALLYEAVLGRYVIKLAYFVIRKLQKNSEMVLKKLRKQSKMNVEHKET